MRKVFVFGDIILDRYCIGSVKRLSPESPVPIVNLQSTNKVLGGAANVAANISALGRKVDLCGIIGKDLAGNDVSELLKKYGVGNKLHELSTAKTIVKTRVIGNNQQIVRIDDEERFVLDSVKESTIIADFKKDIEAYSVVVISDYAKGACTKSLCRQIINLAHENGIAVVVDPKGIEWEKYENATVVTPNLKELSLLMGKDIENDDLDIERQCTGLCDKLKIKNLLLTRSERGMSLFQSGSNEVIHEESKAREVFDVSGAGDTVVAAIAAYVDIEKELKRVIHVANIAAGIVVEKIGTAVVTRKELNDWLEKDLDNEQKIVSLKVLVDISDSWKECGQTICFTNGCFDVLHRGHVQLLKKAATFCDRLIVAINSDKSVRRLKGEERPVNKQEDRAFILSSLKYVDAVIIFDDDTPLELIRNIRPDVLVKGADYTVENVVGREYAGRVELVDIVSNYSTTGILNKIKSQKN